jgi:hypothetical protein
VNALFSIVQSSILLDPALAEGRKLAVVPLIIAEDIPTHNWRSSSGKATQSTTNTHERHRVQRRKFGTGWLLVGWLDQSTVRGWGSAKILQSPFPTQVHGDIFVGICNFFGGILFAVRSRRKTAI